MYVGLGRRFSVVLLKTLFGGRAVIATIALGTPVFLFDMKKIVSIPAILLGVAVAAIGSSCMSKTGVYIIASDTTFPPFEFQDSQQRYVGIDVDLLAAIANDQKFKYELHPIGFNAAVAAIESNQADGMISGMSITDVRKKKYDFSKPYYNSDIVMAVDAHNNFIKSYDDLAGRQVAIKTATVSAIYAESIRDKYNFTVKYFDESPYMYEDVKTGNSVACFEDYPVMNFGIAHGNGLKMVGGRKPGMPLGFAVLKGKHPELLEMFNNGLENLKKSGEYQTILNKYLEME
jgi:polar amino acid transport system substrate-binding protein